MQTASHSTVVPSVFPWQSKSETPHDDARFLHQYSQSSVCNLAHHLAAVRVAKALNRPFAVICVLATVRSWECFAVGPATNRPKASFRKRDLSGPYLPFLD
jgi:hypothetical protein